jgi:hypothetical protein
MILAGMEKSSESARFARSKLASQRVLWGCEGGVKGEDDGSLLAVGYPTHAARAGHGWGMPFVVVRLLERLGWGWHSGWLLVFGDEV